MNLKLVLKTLSQTALAVTLGVVVSPDSVQANEGFSPENQQIAQPTLLLNDNDKKVVVANKLQPELSASAEIAGTNSAILIASEINADFENQNEPTPIKIEVDVDPDSSSSMETESISIPIAVESSSNKTLDNAINIPVVPAVTEEEMAQNNDSNPVVILEDVDAPDFIENNSVQNNKIVVSQQVKNIDTSKGNKQQSSSNSDLLSAVPIQIEYYDPTNSSSVDNMMAPNLPNINSPDAYFPEEPKSFKGYIWPAKGVFTSGYGWRWGRMHKGIDIAAPIGTPIFAAADGQVISSGWNSGGYGNLVKIKHFDGSISLYAHNSKILVRNGEWVKQGQQIAKMGSTGFSTGPHLHFEIHPSGKGAVNPVALLPRKK